MQRYTRYLPGMILIMIIAVFPKFRSLGGDIKHQHSLVYAAVTAAPIYEVCILSIQYRYCCIVLILVRNYRPRSYRTPRPTLLHRKEPTTIYRPFVFPPTSSHIPPSIPTLYALSPAVCPLLSVLCALCPAVSFAFSAVCFCSLSSLRSSLPPLSGRAPHTGTTSEPAIGTTF